MVSGTVAVCFVAMVVLSVACGGSSHSSAGSDGTVAASATVSYPGVTKEVDTNSTAGSPLGDPDRGDPHVDVEAGSLGRAPESGPGQGTVVTTLTHKPGSTGPTMTVGSSGGLTGIVLDFDTKQPVSGVKVQAGGETAISQTDGKFVMSVSIQRGARVDAQKEGYISARALAREGEREGVLFCEILMVAFDSPNAPPPPPGQ